MNGIIPIAVKTISLYGNLCHLLVCDLDLLGVFSTVQNTANVKTGLRTCATDEIHDSRMAY